MLAFAAPGRSHGVMPESAVEDKEQREQGDADTEALKRKVQQQVSKGLQCTYSAAQHSPSSAACSSALTDKMLLWISAAANHKAQQQHYAMSERKRAYLLSPANKSDRVCPDQILK